MIKFGRVRFFIKKLVIDAEDIVESAAAEDINDNTSFTKKQFRQDTTSNNHRVQTTLEHENNSQLLMNGHHIMTDPDTRMTMNFNRETSGFDTRPHDFEQITKLN